MFALSCFKPLMFTSTISSRENCLVEIHHYLNTQELLYVTLTLTTGGEVVEIQLYQNQTVMLQRGKRTYSVQFPYEKLSYMMRQADSIKIVTVVRDLYDLVRFKQKFDRYKRGNTCVIEVIPREA